MQQKSDSLKTPKKSFYFQLFAIFKLKFHQNDRLHLFNKTRHRKRSRVKNFSMKELSTCVPCISVSAVRNFQKALLLFPSILKLVFLSHYKFEFLHQGLNLKHNTCREVLSWKTVDFVRCIRILIVRKFQKNFPLINFLDIQTHPHLSPKTNYKLHFFYEGLN